MPTPSGPGPGSVQIHHYEDLEDRERLAEALRGAHAVVHLAARVHVMKETREDPLPAFRKVNVAGTRSVVATARNCGVEHLIFLSSVKAVGEKASVTEPMNEQTWPRPSDPYGLSKLEAEKLLKESASDGGIAVTVLRPPLVYGPGMGGNMLRLFRLVSRGVPLPLGAVENSRSMLYVGNLTAAITCLLEGSARGFRRFFASDTVDLSTLDLLDLIGAAVDRPPRLVSVPVPLLKSSAALGDLFDRVVRFPFTTVAVERLTESLVVDSTPLWEKCRTSPPFEPDEGFRMTGRWFKDTELED